MVKQFPTKITANLNAVKIVSPKIYVNVNISPLGKFDGY